MLAGSVVFMGVPFAHADPPTAGAAKVADTGPEPTGPTPVPNYWIRLGIAVGGPVNSDQEQLLDLEGYGGARFALSLGVARKLADYVGVGGLVLYGWRSAETDDDEDNSSETVVGVAPTYEEELVALGAQVPLSFDLGRKRNAVFFLTPWAGVGFAKAEFVDRGDWQTGPAFGVGTGMFFPKVYFGFSLGAQWVPLPPPGEAGGHNDFGMIYFALIAGADVG
jgi:hypothetical protein